MKNLKSLRGTKKFCILLSAAVLLFSCQKEDISADTNQAVANSEQVSTDLTPVNALAISGYNPNYPRLGAFTISSPKDYSSSTFLNIASKYHVLVLGAYPGYKANNRDLKAVVDYIHTYSRVGTKVFNYIATNEAGYTTVSTAYKGLTTTLNNTKSWLYKTGTSGTPVASTWAGRNIINISNFGPTISGSGRRWNRYHPHAMWDLFFNGRGSTYGMVNQNPAKLDGLLIDNFFARPRVTGDWDKNGSTDATTTAEMWLRQGEVEIVNQIRTDCPNCYVLGNTVDYKNVGYYTKTLLDQVLDGGEMEGQYGETWSPKGTAAMMAAYKNQMDMYRGDKLGIFSAYVPQGNYTKMRYVLAACSMGNGFLYICNGSLKYDQTLRWMDEFNFNLGQPSQSPVYTANNTSNTYKRSFTNGIVIMNPIGNGTRTISLGARYYKLKGTQSSFLASSGDRTGVTSVTLADGDGIVLSKSPTAL